MESNTEFFRRRASEEDSAARDAIHGAARDAHLEMARRYHELAGSAAPMQSHEAEQMTANAG